MISDEWKSFKNYTYKYDFYTILSIINFILTIETEIDKPSKNMLIRLRMWWYYLQVVIGQKKWINLDDCTCISKKNLITKVCNMEVLKFTFDKYLQ